MKSKTNFVLVLIILIFAFLTAGKANVFPAENVRVIEGKYASEPIWDAEQITESILVCYYTTPGEVRIEIEVNLGFVETPKGAFISKVLVAISNKGGQNLVQYRGQIINSSSPLPGDLISMVRRGEKLASRSQEIETFVLKVMGMEKLPVLK